MERLFISVMLSALPAEVARPSVAEAEKAALGARSSIRTMYVRFKFDKASPARPDRDQQGVRTIWLDGKKVRSEVVYSKGPSIQQRYVDCVHCEKEGYGISWLASPGHLAALHPIGTPGKSDFDQVIDPRVLGYVGKRSSLLRPAQTRLDEVVGSTDRSEPALAVEQVNGVECWAIKWITKSGIAVSVWIAPSRGNNVVRLKLEDPSGSYACSVESEVVSVGKSGLWYPRKVRYEDYEDGKLAAHETVEVEEVRLNEPIAPSVFTLAGLSIPDNTYVQQPDAKQSGYLKNGKIDTSRATTDYLDTTPAPPTPLTPDKGFNYWLIAACVGCVLAAVAVVVIRRRSAAS